MGGYYPIGIQSIRIIESAKNYESVIRALGFLDNFLSDTIIEDSITEQTKQNYRNILLHLIANYLKESNHKITDHYIYDTFACFCKNKQELYVDLFKLKSGLFSGIQGVFFGFDYLFEIELFQVFKFAKKITLDWARQYRISLLSLLSIIKRTSLQKIILLNGFQDYEIASDLAEKYGESGYEIYIEDVSSFEANIIIYQHTNDIVNEDIWREGRGSHRGKSGYDKYKRRRRRRNYRNRRCILCGEDNGNHKYDCSRRDSSSDEASSED